ncbi:MAG TPA: (2Fe-2S)-binding protein, partial [Vicinamibacterales bacterium]|nr:(2Fe-2S)-binding protein [Vicinamibacterales bacterium]
MTKCILGEPRTYAILAGQHSILPAIATARRRQESRVGEIERIALTVNGKRYDVDVSADMPLLWVIRDTIGLTGTKFGCGLSQCGACTVHLDGQPTRSCVTTVSSVGAKKVTTIEGLSPTTSHALQVAWIAEQVPQCGYCQSGQLMSAAALLTKTPNPSDSDID